MLSLLRVCFLLLVMFFAGGCVMMNSTRSLPQTVVENKKIQLPQKYESVPIYFKGFDANDTEIKVLHYEGILQAEQFWIAAPSDEQKKILKESALTLANVGFMTELVDQKLNLQNPNLSPDGKKGWLLRGHIQKIVIRTYGDGFGGYGSAGDYWECNLYLDKLEVISLDTNATQHVKPLQSYAKVIGSPVKLGGFLEGLAWAAKLASMSFMTLPQLAYDHSAVTDLPKYSLGKIERSPVELSARITARMFLSELEKE